MGAPCDYAIPILRVFNGSFMRLRAFQFNGYFRVLHETIFIKMSRGLYGTSCDYEHFNFTGTSRVPHVTSYVSMHGNAMETR